MVEFSENPVTSPLLKVCGATTSEDIALLVRHSVDLVGLWYGIPAGRHCLSAETFTKLAMAAARTETMRAVLVTFLRDADAIGKIACTSGIRCVQLHAYQTPAAVRALRRLLPPEVTIIKVLHIENAQCVETPLIQAYERAGTDIFLFDAATKGRVGSTGSPFLARDLEAPLEKMTRPFLLAGGIRPDNRPRYDEIVTHPGYTGIDVDTGARDAGGRLAPAVIDRIARAWMSTEALR